MLDIDTLEQFQEHRRNKQPFTPGIISQDYLNKQKETFDLLEPFEKLIYELLNHRPEARPDVNTTLSRLKKYIEKIFSEARKNRKHKHLN